MLKMLRNKKTAKKVWIVLAILIVPAFVLWGSGSSGCNKNKTDTDTVGKINGKKVSFLEYRDAINATRTQAIIQFGENFSEVEKYLNLESQAWDRIILLREAKKREINTNDREVVEAVETYPFFQRKGQFDNRTYLEMLKYVFRIQPRSFEEQTRQNLMLTKLYKQLTDSIKLGDEEVKKEYEKANEQLSLYYIASLASDFAKSVTLNAQGIKDYFTNNQLEFKQPLSFNLEYVSSDSLDKLESLLPHIGKNEYFNKIVKDAGLSLKETGLFPETGPIAGVGWSSQILALLPTAKIGQGIGPIQIDKTYYLFRLKDKKEPFIPEFGTIKDKVKEALIKNKTRQIAKTKIDNCYKNLEQAFKKNPNSVNFEKIARLDGLKVKPTEPFKYGSYIEGIGSSDSFWTKAKNLKANEPSDIIALPTGFYIIKLKNLIPVDEKKFQEEKIEFSKKLLLQKKQDRFTSLLEELKKNSQRF